MKRMLSLTLALLLLAGCSGQGTPSASSSPEMA